MSVGGFLYNITVSVGGILYNTTQYQQYYTILPMLHDVANPACLLQVSMSILGFDIAVGPGMSPEEFSKRVHMMIHILTGAAQ